jgi:hypothetical protein
LTIDALPASNPDAAVPGGIEPDIDYLSAFLGKFGSHFSPAVGLDGRPSNPIRPRRQIFLFACRIHSG